MQLARAGIFAQALYGAELMPLGTQHTTALRNQLVDSILGKNASRNSAIAMACIQGIMDPEPFLILQAIKAARRHLLQSEAQEIHDFCVTVSHHSGNWRDCHGPGGALVYYLRKVNWQLDPKGTLWVTGFVQLSLLTTGMSTIRDWLIAAWNEHLLTQHCNRKPLRGLQPISGPETQQVLSKFDAKQKRALINEIAGGFQTRSQQAEWDPDCDGLCAHCSQPDTREHRLYECPLTEPVRRKFATSLQWFVDQGIPAHELPVIHKHEDSEWLHTVYANLPEPEAAPDMYAQLHAIDMQGHQLRFYTDGSCQRPHLPQCRNAGFAVMVDLATTDFHRCHEVACFQSSGQKPQSIQMVTSCLLPGTPGIHRAELAALVFVCERFFNTLIYTDSQVALNIAIKCVQRVPISKFAYHADLDLVTRLWHAVALGTREFRKVAAHSDLQLPPTVDIYHQLGNQCVHDAALAATTYQLPALQKQIHDHAEFQIASQTHLQKLFDFHLEAHYHRAVADDIHRCQPVRQTPARAIDRTQLAAYDVSDPFVGRLARRNQYADSSFGPTLTHLVYTWMTQVKWPQADNLHPLQSLGVTWIELALSFVFSTSCWIPVKRLDDRGDEALLVPRSLADARAHAIKLSEISLSLSNMVKQTLELTDAQPWPDQSKGLVRSLYVLGARVFSQGFTSRPAFPCQDVVQRVLEPYLRLHSGPAFEMLPEVSITAPAALWQSVHNETRGSWPHRCERARAAWRKFNKWKRQMEGQALLRFR